ncbi:MAG: serine/threonine protein kinase [Polyangiaceae bacterium]|nr:serine/threonine protein kinase [Polyangiaceae bacterium]
MATRWAARENLGGSGERRCPRCLRSFSLASAFCPFDGDPLSQLPVEELTEGRPSSQESGLFAGRYAVRGLLGQGAMTHVLLGEDVRSHEPVAIKVLDVSFLGRPEIVERFTREAEALQRVRHPHVVRSFAAGTGADGLPFHVLEHLQGEPLDTLLARERWLHPKQALRLLIQCAAALEAIHKSGVIHRDLKPANLMVFSQEGRLLGVKLVDFGFAHVTGSSIHARATRKDPALRHESARHLRVELEQVAAGAHLEPPPEIEDVFRPGPGLPTRAARFLYGRRGVPVPGWMEEQEGA